MVLLSCRDRGGQKWRSDAQNLKDYLDLALSRGMRLRTNWNLDVSMKTLIEPRR